MRTIKYRKGASSISAIVLGIILALLVLVQLPSAAWADENRVGIEIDVSTHDQGDLSLVGVEVDINTQDAHNISVAAVEVTMEGAASGDVSIAAAEITIEADISGDLSAAAAEVHYTGTVEGETSLAGAEVRFTGTGNDVSLLGDDVYLDGVVNGNLRVGADDFVVTPETVINGNFEFRGEEEPVLPEGLTITGTYSFEYVEFEDIFEGDIPLVIVPVVALAGVGVALTLLVLLPFAVIIGAGVLLLLMTGLTSRTIDGIRQRPFSSVGMGVVVLISLMIIAGLLSITVIGIPLALAIITLYPVLLLLGFIVAVLGIPYLVLRKSPADMGGFAKIGLFFVSLLLLAFLFAIPAIGQIALSLAILMGVGAFGAAVLGGRKEEAA